MTVAVLRYSVLRIAIFLASLLVLSLLGVRRSILMLVLAALISLILSYLLLGGPREALAQEIAGRVEGRIKRPTDEDADVEDAAVDSAAVEAAHRESASQPPGTESA